MDNQEQPFTLFKGATRVPTLSFTGVPVMPFMVMAISVASIAMVVSLWAWLAVPPLWIMMAVLTKNDDRAFRIIGLFLDTKLRNKNTSFWKASTYGPTDYRKPRSRFRLFACAGVVIVLSVYIAIKLRT